MTIRRVLLDANLLVLLIVGFTSPQIIANHKRLQDYSEADFDLLVELLAEYGELNWVVTPHVLTEASNHLRQIRDPHRSDIMASYRIFLAKVPELYVPAAQAAERNEIGWLGLSDAALISISDDDIVLLTVDEELYAAALNAGRHAQNFFHHRASRS